MPRFVPPAGSPLRIKQILSCAGANRPAEQHLRVIAERLRVKYVVGMRSGRAALWLALQSLHRLHPDRDTVAVPAYTCFSVPAAIVRASLKIHPLEIDPRTLDFNRASIAALPESRLLCIIPCNLFGFPNDISVVRDAARPRGAYVVDDAAQAMGSMDGSEPVGTRGDVGIYSLGRGKSIGSVGGGLLVTDSDEIADAARSDEASLVGAGEMSGAALLFKMLGYSLFLHPRLFWIPNSLPFLKLGITEFDPLFTVGKMPRLSTAVLEKQLPDELDRVNRVRQANAKAITEGLRGMRTFEVPNAGIDNKPTFVRLPVVAADRATRDRAIALLRAKGIGATTFYPSAICDIPGIDKHMSEPNLHCAQAEQLSERLFTLPVHPLLQERDIERIVETLEGLEGHQISGTRVAARLDELKPGQTVASSRADQKLARPGSGPRVSVVIPTYNSADMVREAVASVLGQTYSDYEVVVIDDGSADHTESAMRQFGDRVRYFKQENQGAGAARNSGIRRARGEYVAFLDSDDLWSSKKLDEQIPLLERDPEIGLVYSDWAVVSENRVVEDSYLRKVPSASGYVFDQLVRWGFILTSGVVVRRACLDDIGDFDNSLSIAQDYDLWLRICYRWKVALVNKPLVTKRSCDGSLSSNLLKTATERIALFEKALTTLRGMPSRSRRLIKRQLALNYVDVGYYYFDQFLLKEARKKFLTGLGYEWTNAKALGYLAASCLPRPLAKAVRGMKQAIS
jgi:dTDP-4-amino-4,6-dideoxygalactose transaminase/glycosyltransferase involved in cell wall biosynthesis